MNDEQIQAQLIAAQMKHAIDLLKADIQSLSARVDHNQKLIDHRLAALERQVEDHEERIRAATAGVTQFKLFSGLASGGSSLASLAALLKAFFGG
jgi:hypothetical protein